MKKIGTIVERFVLRLSGCKSDILNYLLIEYSVISERERQAEIGFVLGY